MEPRLRSVKFLRQEAELGYENKDVAKYTKEQQALVREKRAAWRDAQKRQADIRMAEVQTEEKTRAGEIQIQIQMAKIEADKEITLKKMELKAQAQASSSPAVDTPPHNRYAKSPKLPAFTDEKGELDIQPASL